MTKDTTAMRLRTRCGVMLALLLVGGDASARPLQVISERGTLALCANPDALPFASKFAKVPGFQIELAEKLAEKLGVSLTRQWVLSAIQYRRADCDVVLDTIADRAALADSDLRPSRPYQRSGVVLAVRGGSAVSSVDGLRPGQRVGVPVGSLVSMILGKRGVTTTPYVFEAEILAALGAGEIEAGAVTPAAIGWYNVSHPDAPVRSVPAFAAEPDLNWNLAVGMIGPDEKLRQRVDAAIGDLLADGTVARIYARYGIESRPPQ
jgi:polar amino acid transport system substrate-binding protein